MAISTNLVAAVRIPEPSLGASTQENSIIASNARNVSLDSPKVPATSCPESLHPTKTCEAQPAGAKTSNQSDAEETTMAVAVAPIIPPEISTPDRAIPFKNVDEKETVPTQDVSQETPDSPATPSSSLDDPSQAPSRLIPMRAPRPLLAVNRADHLDTAPGVPSSHFPLLPTLFPRRR
jgi:hypothetical protein